MNRIKMSVGVLAIAALALAAFAASASAAPTITLEHCSTEAGTATTFKNKTCTSARPAEEITTHWKVIATGVPVVVIPENSTTYTLKSTNGGITFTIQCTALTGSGTSTAAATSIAGSEINLTYTGCTVTAPSGRSCVVRGSTNTVGSGEISTVTLKSTLVGLEPTTSEPMYKITYSPKAKTGTEELFTTIDVEGCTTSALNGAKKVTGTAVATIDSEGMVQKFTETSGSALIFGGQTAVFTGTSELHTKTKFGVRVTTP